MRLEGWHPEEAGVLELLSVEPQEILGYAARYDKHFVCCNHTKATHVDPGQMWNYMEFVDEPSP